MVLEKGKLTDEGLKDLRSRIGSYFSVGSAASEVPEDSIRHFAIGVVGDTNPLWNDQEYARKTKWGGLIAPPSYLYAVVYPTGMRAGGLAGVHAYHSGNNWEWYKQVRMGDFIRGTYQLKDVTEKQSKFAGRILIVSAEIVYFNQLDEVVAKTIGWSIRAERGASQKKGKYGGIRVHKYSDQEIEAINQMYENEVIRGATPRYWEDVNVGDEIPPVVKGPFSPTDMIACFSGMGGGGGGGWGIGVAHGVKIKQLRKHPGFSFRDPETGALGTIAEVHTMTDVARGAAVPYAYDIGTQRNSWLIHALTNWMGDDGFLKKLNASYRRFNVYGDTQFAKGKVTKKYIQNGEHLVDVEVWCENQRGEVTAPGEGTIVLPSKATIT